MSKKNVNLLIDVHLSQHKVSSLALENSFLQYGDVRDTMQTQLLGIKKYSLACGKQLDITKTFKMRTGLLTNG